MTSLRLIIVIVRWLAIDRKVFSIRIEFLSSLTRASCATPCRLIKMLSPAKNMVKENDVLNQCIKLHIDKIAIVDHR